MNQILRLAILHISEEKICEDGDVHNSAGHPDLMRCKCTPSRFVVVVDNRSPLIRKSTILQVEITNSRSSDLNLIERKLAMVDRAGFTPRVATWRFGKYLHVACQAMLARGLPLPDYNFYQTPFLHWGPHGGIESPHALQSPLIRTASHFALLASSDNPVNEHNNYKNY